MDYHLEEKPSVDSNNNNSEDQNQQNNEEVNEQNKVREERVVILSIAYHNMGVELEYLKRVLSIS